jgi:hypothetical protein
MRSLYATSLMVMSAQALKLNPDGKEVSPDYTDWFEHPTYMDAHYADYYGRDTSNAVNAAEVAGVDYLVDDPKQYWVENWYVDSSMPIKPKVKWDSPPNLSADQKLWRNNKWVDESVTAANEQPGLLQGEYQNLLKKLASIELNNVKAGKHLYAPEAKKLKLLLKTLEELNEDEEEQENVQVDEDME